MAETLVLLDAAGGSVRLPAPSDRAALAGFCRANRLDWAIVPTTRRLADLRLVAMDMDSTVITIECIDEIADLQGLKPQVAAITAAAMRGEIDFAESLRRRVALLAGLPESALERVWRERLRFSPGAERLMTELRQRGIRTLLVSGGFTYFTERVKAALAIDEAHSNVLEIRDAHLTGQVVGAVFDGAAKARAVRETITRLGIDRSQAVVIGDGANDLAMMAEAGTSIAFRAKPVVREKATCAFDFVGLDGLLALFG